VQRYRPSFGGGGEPSCKAKVHGNAWRKSRDATDRQAQRCDLCLRFRRIEPWAVQNWYNSSTTAEGRCGDALRSDGRGWLGSSREDPSTAVAFAVGAVMCGTATCPRLPRNICATTSFRAPLLLFMRTLSHVHSQGSPSSDPLRSVTSFTLCTLPLTRHSRHAARLQLPSVANCLQIGPRGNVSEADAWGWEGSWYVRSFLLGGIFVT